MSPFSPLWAASWSSAYPSPRRDQPEQVHHLDPTGVRGRADRLEVRVDTLEEHRVALERVVRLAQIERADVANRHQRVRAGLLGVGEDARVQVQVVVGLGLVDVSAPQQVTDSGSTVLQADLRSERLRRDVEPFAESAARQPL